MTTKAKHDIHGKPYNRTAMITLLLIATFAGVLNQTSLGTAIPTLMNSFNISLSTAQQATTWFLLANGIMIPVSAYLATRFSTKWLYVTSYVVLLNGLVVGLAPAIGPTLAGWILKQEFHFAGHDLTWRAIFLLPLLILTVTTILSPFVLKDVVDNKSVKLEVPSLILSIIGFGSFLWGFTNVATYGWGDIGYVISPTMVGIIFIALFIHRQLKLETPFLDIRVFKNKQFSVTTAAIALSMMAMMGVEMMLPLYLQNVHGLSALDSGLALLPGALMMGIVSPISGAVYDKVGARRMAMIGFTILGVATLPFVFLTTTTPDHFITLLYAVRMFGIAMVMMPLTASAMSALPPHEAAHGTAANNTARQIASAVVVALLSSVAQNIITNNKPSKDLLTMNPLKYANQMLNASLDGFHVSFAIGFVFAVLGLLVSLFLRKGKIIETEKEV